MGKVRTLNIAVVMLQRIEKMQKMLDTASRKPLPLGQFDIPVSHSQRILQQAMREGEATGGVTILNAQPGGVGKTRVAMLRALEIAREGGKVAIACKNHNLIKEASDTLLELARAGDGKVPEYSIYQGPGYACDWKDPRTGKRIIESFPDTSAWKAGPCVECDRKGKCAVFIFDEEVPIVFIPHALLSTDRGSGLVADRHLIIDERIEAHEDRELPANALRKWLDVVAKGSDPKSLGPGPQAIAAALEVVDSLTKSCVQSKVENENKLRHPVHYRCSEISAVIDELGLREVLRAGMTKPKKSLWAGEGGFILDGTKGPEQVSPPSIWEFIVAMVAAGDPESMAKSGQIEIVASRKSERLDVEMVLRRESRLPRAKSTIVLDATADEDTADLLRRITDQSVTLRTFSFVRDDVRSSKRIFLQTKNISRSRLTELDFSTGVYRLTTPEDAGKLFRKGDRTRAGTEHVTKVMDLCLTKMVGSFADSGREKIRVGVVSYMAVIAAMETGALARWREKWESKGFAFELGHYGRDEFGSNRFENMDGFIALGAPYRNPENDKSIAMVHGVDPGWYTAMMTRSATAQTLYRAREIHNPDVVLFYVGRPGDPIPWAEEEYEALQVDTIGRPFTYESEVNAFAGLLELHGSFPPKGIEWFLEMDDKEEDRHFPGKGYYVQRTGSFSSLCRRTRGNIQSQLHRLNDGRRRSEIVKRVEVMTEARRVKIPDWRGSPFTLAMPGISGEVAIDHFHALREYTQPKQSAEVIPMPTRAKQEQEVEELCMVAGETYLSFDRPDPEIGEATGLSVRGNPGGS